MYLKFSFWKKSYNICIYLNDFESQPNFYLYFASELHQSSLCCLISENKNLSNYDRGSYFIHGNWISSKLIMKPKLLSIIINTISMKLNRWIVSKIQKFINQSILLCNFPPNLYFNPFYIETYRWNASVRNMGVQKNHHKLLIDVIKFSVKGKNKGKSDNKPIKRVKQIGTQKSQINALKFMDNIEYIYMLPIESLIEHQKQI